MKTIIKDTHVVTDCGSVEEFRRKHMKRFSTKAGRSLKEIDKILKAELLQFGHCSIPGAFTKSGLMEVYKPEKGTITKISEHIQYMS